MSFFKIDNVKIRGISVSVPKHVEENSMYHLFNKDEFGSFVATTGVERKRKGGELTCTSDLCIAAAESLISHLNWNKDDISIIVLATQTADFIIPSTAPIIQNKLGLNTKCYAIDISLGCSGWVYGMSVICSLLSNMFPVSSSMNNHKAILLAGDTLRASIEDKSTYPLFGDAGTATALEFHEESDPILFSTNSDGGGYESIIIYDGGFRNPTSLSSFSMINRGERIVSNNLQLVLDGMNVFSFGISKAPESVNDLINTFGLDKDQIDYFTFHQANLFMNEKIRKKLKLSAEKVPYSLKNYGNTSSASIPLTMVTELNKPLKEKELRHIACGFGVGLSWASMYFKTNNIVCPEIVEV